MTWDAIKQRIITHLINNVERELKTPDRRLRELENVEKVLSKEYINDPLKLLTVDKEVLKASLGLRSGAAKSIVNNIYSVLNDEPIPTKKRK